MAKVLVITKLGLSENFRVVLGLTNEGRFVMATPKKDVTDSALFGCYQTRRAMSYDLFETVTFAEKDSWIFIENKGA